MCLKDLQSSFWYLINMLKSTMNHVAYLGVNSSAVYQDPKNNSFPLEVLKYHVFIYLYFSNLLI